MLHWQTHFRYKCRRRRCGSSRGKSSLWWLDLHLIKPAKRWNLSTGFAFSSSWLGSRKLYANLFVWQTYIKRSSYIQKNMYYAKTLCVYILLTDFSLNISFFPNINIYIFLISLNIEIQFFFTKFFLFGRKTAVVSTQKVYYAWFLISFCLLLCFLHLFEW